MIGRHATKASPDVPGGQVQVGIWLITSQCASCPHVPGQGSTQRWLLQALFRGQSEFMVHSGRQPEYGSPKYRGRQVQMPSWQSAFAPHGDGLQGSFSIGVSWTGTKGTFLLQPTFFRGEKTKWLIVRFPRVSLKWTTWINKDFSCKTFQEKTQNLKILLNLFIFLRWVLKFS